MGRIFRPSLRGNNKFRPVGQDSRIPTDDEVEALFEALIIKINTEERDRQIKRDAPGKPA